MKFFKRKDKKTKKDEERSTVRIIDEMLGSNKTSNTKAILEVYIKEAISHNHTEINIWFKKELTGYNNDEKIPDFRKIQAKKFTSIDYLKRNLPSYETVPFNMYASIIEIIRRLNTSYYYYLLINSSELYRVDDTILKNIINSLNIVIKEYVYILENDCDEIDYLKFLQRNKIVDNDALSEIEKKISKIQSSKIFKFTNLPSKFYKQLIMNMNISYRYRLYGQVRVLQRKLLENIIVDLLRKRYKPVISTFFDEHRGRFHNFGDLIETFKKNVNDFKPYLGILDSHYIGTYITPFKNKGNASAHSIEFEVNQKDVKKDLDKFNTVVETLLDMLSKIP